MPEQIQEIPEKPVQSEIVPEVRSQRNPFKLVLLVVLGLIVLVGAVYAGVIIGKKQSPPEIIPQAVEASPTPSETANWKTYTSEKGKFFIKYPSQWNMVGGGEYTENTLDFIDFGPEVKMASPKGGHGEVGGIVVEKTGQVFEYIDRVYGDRIEDLGNRVIDGSNAIYFYTLGDFGPKQKYIVFNGSYSSQRGPYFYTVMLYYDPIVAPDYKENEKLLELMLSTFKFLE